MWGVEQVAGVAALTLREEGWLPVEAQAKTPIPIVTNEATSMDARWVVIGEFLRILSVVAIFKIDDISQRAHCIGRHERIECRVG